MSNGAGLEVADVVGRVMYKLQVPDAALMRFLQSLELRVEEVEPFDIGDDRGLPRLMRSREIRRAKGATHAMGANQLAHPGEPLEMMTIELSRAGHAHRGQGALGL